uniref:IkappaB kinase n=1 Tax=Ciona intestinalis TaxID=7719 RepID=Q4H3C0_CIOIN|nr:IkappaB kinase [Ciona intestinalis]BAE06507.1 IkappaB kinase [Ciona intestinalis]|eukprot:NP_001071740.1 IkappaB kinase [Ciona intestinalis]
MTRFGHDVNNNFGSMNPHPAHNSSPIRSTLNYVWSTTEILGQGATGFVFKGREKKTGQEYAIKVFNSLNYMARSLEARRREFEVLRKVDHKNVVRLFSVEEELTTKHDVIIMELCPNGSLYSMLDDPENLYGLPESEFHRVLSHITAGMKHLHDKGIVHRDLKPGNIMRSLDDDGTAVYKLTDFGAARELGDDEQFMSLYGTEEYLHPDIYERAVLRKHAGKMFSATVDLWSLGVTLYHVATGMLPFRPYGGARRNKDVMYRITTEKPSGVISGVQHSERGSIEWSRELPKTCRLSHGFKKIFTVVLSGILECNPHKIWTFDRYFAEVEDILSKKVINVFSVPNAMLHKVYISPEKTLVSFQEAVAELTEVRSSKQLLLFDGEQFEMEQFVPVKSYPHTTPEHPLILFSSDINDFQAITIPHTCKPPKVKPSLSLDNDSSLAKVCSSTLFDIRKSVSYLLLVQILIRLSVKWFVCYLKSRVVKLKLLRSNLQCKVDCLRTALEIFEEHYQRETSLLTVITNLVTSPPEVNELKLYFTQITEKAKILRQIRTEFDQLNESTNQFDKLIIQEEIPSSIFVDEGSQTNDRLEERMKVASEKSREISRLFKTHKKIRRLSHSDDQLHKFEKQRLAEVCEASVTLFTDKSVPGCKRLHKESINWFSNMNEYQKKLWNCETRIMRLSDRCQDQQESIRTLQRVYRDKLSLVESILKENAKPLSAASLPGPNLNVVQPSIAVPSSWPNSIDNPRSSRQRQLKQLRQGLIEAKNSLNEVKCEVQTGSEILKKLSSLTANRNCASPETPSRPCVPMRTND